MAENGSDGNAGKNQKDSVILVYRMLAVHHSLRIIQNMEIGAAWIDWFKMQYLAKMLIKLFLEVIWWNWIRRLDHCLRRRLMNGSCISCSSKKEKQSFVQFVRSSSEKIYRSNFLWQKSSKKDVHRITWYKDKVHQRSQLNYEHITNSKGHQLQCIELNETINHMLGHGIELKSLHLDDVRDWKHPEGRCKLEFLKKVRHKVEYQ